MNKLYIFLISAVFVSGMTFVLPAHADVTGGDITPPAISGIPELNETTGVLTITFDETVDIDSIIESRFHIRESGAASGGVIFDTGDLITTSNSPTIKFKLSESKRLVVVALTNPALTVGPYSVSDIAGNRINSFINLQLDVTGVDTTPPAILGTPTLDENIGILTITFDEAIDVNTVSGSGFHIQESDDASEGVTLSNPYITKDGGPAIKFALGGSSRQSVIAMSAPALYVDADSVRDISGNGIAKVSNQELDVTEYDGTSPTILGNPTLDRVTRTLTITFDEPVSVSIIIPYFFHIVDSDQTSDGIQLLGYETVATSGDTVIQYVLTEQDFDLVIAMDSPTLDVGTLAVRDLSNNFIEPIRLKLDVTGNDATPPAISGTPQLNKTTGVLTVTFDEPVDASSVLALLFYIRESGDASAGVRLSDDELTTTSDGTTVKFTLAEPSLETIVAMDVPILNVGVHALFDTSGNGIESVKLELNVA